MLYWKSLDFVKFKYTKILLPIEIFHFALSGRTGSALGWHTRGRVLEHRLLQQVLQFVERIYTVQFAELGGTAHEGGVRPVNWIYRL